MSSNRSTLNAAESRDVLEGDQKDERILECVEVARELLVTALAVAGVAQGRIPTESELREMRDLLERGYDVLREAHDDERVQYVLRQMVSLHDGLMERVRLSSWDSVFTTEHTEEFSVANPGGQVNESKMSRKDSLVDLNLLREVANSAVPPAESASYEYEVSGVKFTAAQLANVRGVLFHKDAGFLAPNLNCPPMVYVSMMATLSESSVDFCDVLRVVISLDLLTWTNSLNENGELMALAEFFNDKDEVGRIFVNICLCLVSIYDNSSYVNIGAQLLLLVNNSSLGESMRTRLVDRISRIRLDVNEAGEEDDKFKSEIFEKKVFSIMGFSPLMQSFWDIVSCFSVSAIIKSVGFPDDSPVTVILSSLRKVCSGDKMDTLFQKVFRFCQMLCNRLLDAFKTGDITQLFGTVMPPHKWLELVATVCDDMTIRRTTPGNAKHFKEKRDAGKMNPYIVEQVDETERLGMLEQLESLGQVYLSSDFKSWIKEETFVVFIRSKIDKIQREANMIRNRVSSGQYREQPFGIYFHGAAGGGKSGIVEAIRKELAHSQGWTTDESSVYHPVAGANFMDGFDHSHFFMIFDDVDQKVADAAYSDTTYVEWVLQYINIKPAQIESAHVEDKGKIYANPKCVMMASNYEGLDKVERKIQDVTAFWRRFPLKILVEVKEAFATSTGGLDLTKLDGSNRYWKFSVSRYNPQNFAPGVAGRNNPHTLMKVFESRYELLKFVVGEFKEHRRVQASSLALLIAPRTPCPVCDISLMEHDGGVACTVIEHGQNESGEVSLEEAGLHYDGQAVVDGDGRIVLTEDITDYAPSPLRKLLKLVNFIRSILTPIVIILAFILLVLSYFGKLRDKYVKIKSKFFFVDEFERDCALCGKPGLGMKICMSCLMPSQDLCQHATCSDRAISGSNQGCCLHHHLCVCGQPLETHVDMQPCRVEMYEVSETTTRVVHPLSHDPVFRMISWLVVILQIILWTLLCIKMFLDLRAYWYHIWSTTSHTVYNVFIVSKGKVEPVSKDDILPRLRIMAQTRYEDVDLDDLGEDVRNKEEYWREFHHRRQTLDELQRDVVRRRMRGRKFLLGPGEFAITSTTEKGVVLDGTWQLFELESGEIHNVYDMYLRYFGLCCLLLMWAFTALYACGFWGWVALLAMVTYVGFQKPEELSGLCTWFTTSQFVPAVMTGMKHYAYVKTLHYIGSRVPFDESETERMLNATQALAGRTREDLENLWTSAIARSKEAMSLRFHKYGKSLALAVLGTISLMGAFKLSKRLLRNPPTNEALVHDDAPRPNVFGKLNTFVAADVPRKAYESSAPLNTTSKEQLVEVIRSRMWLLSRLRDGKTVTVWGFVYDSNLLLAPKHFFSNQKDVLGRVMDVMPRLEDIVVSNGDIIHKVSSVEGVNLRIIPGRDLALLRVVELFPLSGINRAGHIPTYTHEPVSGSVLDAGWLVHPRIEGKKIEVDVIESASNPVYVRPSGLFRAPYVAYDAPTQEGWCGSLLIGKSYNKLFLASMHVFKSHADGKATPYGEELCKTEIELAASEIRKANMILSDPVAQIDGYYFDPKARFNFESGVVARVEVEPLPFKSSLRVAKEGGVNVEVVGTLRDKFPGSNMRSKCAKSILFDDLEGLHVGLLGETSPYTKPTFGGHMSEGTWVDPFVVNLKKVENVHIPPDLVIRAVKDYMKGAESLPGWNNVKPMTLQEALAGVPGNINGVNLKTSMGAPMFTNKSHYIRRSKIDMEVQTILLDRIERIIAIMEMGSFPAGVAWHTMKDEVVSKLKEAARKIRVFNTLPADFNIVLKMFLTPFENFMRQHREFFEGAAGMNCTSTDWDDLGRHILGKNPSGKKCGAGDFEGFDVKQSTSLLDGVRMVYNMMSQLAAYSDLDRMMVEMCVYACIYTVRVIKNDVFLMTSTNPSGGQATLVINTLSNALLFRICFFLAGFVDDFRDVIALMLLGDDNIYNVVATHDFSQWTMRDSVARFGHVYTSAVKGEALREYVDFTDMSFLKRGFRFEEELGLLVAPMDKKAILKIAMWVRHTELPLVDQCAVNATNACREAFLHGKEFFETFKYVVDKASRAKGVNVSSKYAIKTWDEYISDYKKGEFITWDDSYVDFPSVDFVDVRNESSDLPADVEPGGSGSLTTHVLSGEVASSVVTTDTTHVQPIMSDVSVGNFLSREVLIYSGSFATTDVFAAATTVSSNLWLSLLANSYVQQKVAGYVGIRGDIEVRIISSCASTLSGLYNFEMNWYSSTAMSTAAQANVYNSTQDIHGFLNCSLSNEVVLVAPFVSKGDYADLLTNQDMPSWRLTMRCLAPLLENLAAGVTTASFNVYARLLPGYDLMIPVVQMGHPQKPRLSAGVATVSSGVSMIGAAVPFIAPLARAVSGGLTMASDLLSTFGFTRESHPQEPMGYVQRGFGNVATLDGVDHGVVAALTNGNSVSIDPRLMGGSGQDPMAFASLMPRQTIVGVFQWAPSAAVGSVLHTMPVAPGYGLEPTTGFIQMPVCGYIGFPFMGWRGSMEYEVYIVASSLHRGKIQVYWNHNQVPPAADPTNQVANAIVDLDHAVSTRFRVGYAGRRPTLEMKPMLPATIDASAVNGFLTFRVNTKLNGPSTTGVTIIIMANGGSDLRFGCPRTLDINNKVFEGDVMYNEGQVGDDVMGEVPVDLVRSSSNYPLRESQFGEEFNSVRGFCQKLSRLPTLTLKVSEAGPSSDNQYVNVVRFSIPFYPRVPTASSATAFPYNMSWSTSGTLTAVYGSYPFTWLAHYSHMFLEMKGGVRIKGVVVSPDDNTVAGTLTVSTRKGAAHFDATSGTKSTLTFGTGTLGGSMPGAVAVGQQLQNGFEFTVPFCEWSERHYYGVGCQRQDKNIDFEMSYTYIRGGADTNDYMRRIVLWQGGSSDFSCERFFRTPALQFSTSSQPNALMIAEESTGIESAMLYKPRALSALAKAPAVPVRSYNPDVPKVERNVAFSESLK